MSIYLCMCMYMYLHMHMYTKICVHVFLYLWMAAVALGAQDRCISRPECDTSRVILTAFADYWELPSDRLVLGDPDMEPIR